MVDGNKIVDDWKKWKESEEKTQDEMVDDLLEAWKIDGTLKLVLKYLKARLINERMSLLEAMCALEKKKFELISMDPEEAEDGEDENEPQ